MPRIGYYHTARYAAPYGYCISESTSLRLSRSTRPTGLSHARCLQLPALKNMHYSVGPVDKQTYAHSRQSHSHQQRGERLELAVAVWMTLVVLCDPDTETKARTIMSVTESDNEWTASAIMAEFIAHRPATNLPEVRSIFTAKPINVTLRASLTFSI